MEKAQNTEFLESIIKKLAYYGFTPQDLVDYVKDNEPAKPQKKSNKK